jgi:hypothetical protein
MSRTNDCTLGSDRRQRGRRTAALVAAVLSLAFASSASGQATDGFEGVRPPPGRAIQRPPEPRPSAPDAPAAPPPPRVELWAGESDAAPANCPRLSIRVRREGARLTGEITLVTMNGTVPASGVVSADGRVTLVAQLPQAAAGFSGRIEGDRMALNATHPAQCQRAATLVRQR